MSFDPTKSTDRIQSLDILRGVALLGILLMNIVGFGLSLNAYYNPTVAGGAEGANLWAWITTNVLFEGTMRAIFSMLFGAGAYLFITRLENRGAGLQTADLYYRRTLWLIIFGLIHAYILLWWGEILFAYGLFGLLLFPLRNLSIKKTAILVAFLILTPALYNLYKYRNLEQIQHNYELSLSYKNEKNIPERIQKDRDQWLTLIGEFEIPKDLEEGLKKGVSSTYFDAFRSIVPINILLQSYYNYLGGYYDVLAVMLLGMLLFKIGILSGQASNMTYLLLLLIGYGIGLTINILETKHILNNHFGILSFLQTSRSYILGRLFTAIGHISVVLLFARLPWLNWLKHSLSSVGKMALTNYISQSIFCALLFYGFGMNLYNQLQRIELYIVVASIWLFQMLISPIWLHYFTMGPAEWFWRRLTYQTEVPLRRSLENE